MISLSKPHAEEHQFVGRQRLVERRLVVQQQQHGILHQIAREEPHQPQHGVSEQHALDDAEGEGDEKENDERGRGVYDVSPVYATDVLEQHDADHDEDRGGAGVWDGAEKRREENGHQKQEATHDGRQPGLGTGLDGSRGFRGDEHGGCLEETRDYLLAQTKGKEMGKEIGKK